MSDLISIITPAYNAAKYIADTIDSVRAQTYVDWELVIVDDGSIDATQAIVKRYCALDARIRYIYQANGRQGKARNHGLAVATGIYVAFLDSDDLWLPTMLAEQLTQLKLTGADLVFSGTYTFKSHFDIQSAGKMPTAVKTFSGDTGIAAFLIGNCIPILTVLCKRNAIDRAGGFSENPLIQNAEDYHLWLKMLITGSKLVGVDLMLTAYRQHSASVSSADGLNHSQGVEARYELSQSYPEKRLIILPAIRHAILTNLAYGFDLPIDVLYQTIDRYLLIDNKFIWRPIFKIFKKIDSTELAIRSAYFIFNYC